MVEHPAAPDLEQLTVPCALLYGTQDGSASRAALPALLARNHRLTHLEVDGTHHLPARQPDLVADVLRQLLAGPGRRKRSPAAAG